MRVRSIRKSILYLLALLGMTFSGGQYLGASYPAAFSYPSYQRTYAYPVAANYSYPVYNYNTNNFVYPAAIPLYSVGYQNPNAVISGAVSYSQQIVTTQSSVQSVLGAALVGTSSTVQTQDALLAERLVSALERIAGNQVGTLKKEQQEAIHIGVLRKECASCHKGQNSKAKFQLFDDAGVYLQPDAEGVGKILYRLSTREAKLRMPPNSKLVPDDKDLIVEGLITQQPQEASIQSNGKQDPKKEDGF